MDQEKYHDAIRKKLESIEPEYQPSDWEEMQAFMSVQTPSPTFWQLNGKNILLGGTATLLVASLIFNAKQFYDNKLLLADAKKNITTIRPSTEREIIYKTDTVYVDRYSPNTVEKIKTVYVTINSEKPTTIAVEKPVQDAVSTTIKDIARENLEENKNSSLTQNQKVANDKTGNNNKVENTETDKQLTGKSDDFNSNKTDGKTNPIIGKSNGNFGKTGNGKLEPDKSDKFIASQSVGNQVNTKSFDWAGDKLTGVGSDNRFVKTFKAFPEITYSPKKFEDCQMRSNIVIRLPKINFKNMRYRYGISGDVGTEQWAVGFTNELLLTPRWAINVGLRLNVSQGKDYLTYQQFNLDNNGNFVNTYTDFKQPVSDILNIKFQNYFLQMPVGISYRLPLNYYGIAILGNIGTDLDLAGKEYVTYEYSFDNAKFEEGNNLYWVKNPIFSNAVFSIGLEKKYRNYVFQLRPYILTQFRQSANRREDVIFGAKLNLMYQSRK